VRVCIAKTRRNEYAKDDHRAYREAVFFHSIVSIIRDLVKEDHQEWVGRKRKARAMTMRKLSKQEIERIVSLLRGQVFAG